MRAAIVLLALAACGQRTTRRDGPPMTANQAPDAGGAPASTYRCDSAQDCTLDLLAGATDCCENACEKTPYHVDELAALREAAQAHCADKVEECTKRECKRARNLVPACVGGTCTAVEPSCASDDDCVLSKIQTEHDCCASACLPAYAYHRDQLAALESARQAHCADKVEECPAECRPVTDHLFPSCVDGVCTAVER